MSDHHVVVTKTSNEGDAEENDQSKTEPEGGGRY